MDVATMLCNQLDSIQSMLPAPSSSLSSIAPATASSFVHAATEPPPASAELTPAERIELERIARCNPRRQAQPSKSLKDTDHSDTEEFVNEEDGSVLRLPHITNYTPLLAYDGSHVLVGGEDRKPLMWLPYMYLRYGCRAMNKKSRFEARLLELRPGQEYSALPRIAANELRQVQYLHYYPRGERVLYKIGNARGLAPVKELADVPALKEFIRQQKALIEAEDGSTKRSTAIRRFGLGLKHDDVTPQLNADEEYAFMFEAGGSKKRRVHFLEPTADEQPAKKRSCAEAARSNSEEEAAAILMEMMMAGARR